MSIRKYVTAGLVTSALALNTGCFDIGLALWRDARNEKRHQQRIVAQQEENLELQRRLQRIEQQNWERENPGQPLPAYLSRPPEPLYGVKSIIVGSGEDRNGDGLILPSEIIPKDTFRDETVSIGGFVQLPPGGGKTNLRVYRGRKKVVDQVINCRADNMVWYHEFKPFWHRSGNYTAEISYGRNCKLANFTFEK